MQEKHYFVMTKTKMAILTASGSLANMSKKDILKANNYNEKEVIEFKEFKSELKATNYFLKQQEKDNKDGNK